MACPTGGRCHPGQPGVLAQAESGQCKLASVGIFRIGQDYFLEHGTSVVLGGTGYWAQCTVCSVEGEMNLPAFYSRQNVQHSCHSWRHGKGLAHMKLLGMEVIKLFALAAQPRTQPTFSAECLGP